MELYCCFLVFFFIKCDILIGTVKSTELCLKNKHKQPSAINARMKCVKETGNQARCTFPEIV